ncbi:uncharacterized protein I206_105115 [Kwoniella pini CBS 10737]|uniref:Major facilitator superfamily (MFS) profile domain-containing protein n=1 Tax=Kwoniella pini CBS 10737 TaxID=1296096 RepID=A0A1B9I8U5_9TREE|nr:uncharacterized protein I206_02656 [Kwoniella pini CBS 10737]OCF51940.1 hypothetical protein I206_02656 [Kwoniella pini CBS 10737]
MSHLTDAEDILPVEDDKHVLAEHHDNEVQDYIVKPGGVAAMSAEDRHTALRLARAADPGISMRDWRMAQWVFYITVVLMCGGDAGFDGTVMGAVNSMKQWQKYFGLTSASGSTGIVFGMYSVGQTLAFFPAAYLPDKIGRRWGMAIGNLTLILGALLTSQAHNFQMFIWGRMFTGLGCTLAASSAKSYMSEITPPHSRGRYMGLLNSFYYVGQLMASGISIPLGRKTSNWSWRGPLLLQAAPAVINFAFVMLLPESPRWLFINGRDEQAGRVLAKLHSRDNDVNSPMVLLQLGEFEENLVAGGADKRWWDFRALFKTRANRYRFGMCAIIAIWGAWAGNALISYFLPVLLEQAGINSPDRQRVLNFANSLTSFGGALAGTALTDYMGRRPLLLSGITSCMVGMALAAGLLSPAGAQTATRANAGITFIFLFMVGYSFGITPLQGLYVAENLSMENRAKGIALQTWLGAACNLINTFAIPSALKALRWKTYLIFFAVDFVGVIVIYLFAVETKRLSLEDLDHIFEAKNPKQESFALAKAARERYKREKEAEKLNGL